MLSVTTATVHRAMCPSTPQNTTPERKDRFWSCDNNQLSKRRSRPNTSRKNLSLRLTDPLELNVEVTSHSIPLPTNKTPERTPKSKIPVPKTPSSLQSTLKPRRHSLSLFKHEKSPRTNRCPNALYKEESLRANNAVKTAEIESSEYKPKVLFNDEKSTENVQKEKIEENYPKPLVKSNSPLPGEKRKRRSESRMSMALKMLKSDENDVDNSKNRPTPSVTASIEEEKIDAPVDDIFPADTQFQNIQEPDNCLSEENWNKFSQDNWQENDGDNWVNPYNQQGVIWYNNPHSNLENWDADTNDTPPEAPYDDIHHEEPFYMIGFPNELGENRCWLNATLQTIFALPLVDPLENINLNRCSELTRTLVAIQLFWKKGFGEREKTYRTVTRFKDQLRILDESYCTFSQQDVSEFLMKLLNHVKSDCDRILKEIESPDEIENIPDNISSPKSVSRSPGIRRAPLTQISPFKNMNGADVSGESSVKCQELREEIREFIKNPIDKFFLLPMMEHYICQNCSKHRERNVDNMMLYVDLPENETGPIDLSAAIKKTLEPEERTSKCDKCKQERHRLHMAFREPPNVLIVQINRYGMNDGCVEKMNSIVEIPEVLEITGDDSTNEVLQGQEFVPVSVIAHVGSAMDCGHYTSYVKHDEHWFHYNDMLVAPMSMEEALTAAQTTAYLVFFVNAELLFKSPSFSEVSS